MSDLSIPGVTGNIDTASMIDALLESDRTRIERKQEEIDTLKEEKRVWQDLRGRLAQLDESARALYSFQNPFEDKVGVSSDPGALTATVTREAERESHSYRILQTAKADRFMSRPLPEDFEVPAGSYRFKVGEQELSFNFGGGSLEELAQTINRRSRDLLSARVIRNTPSTRVIVIESGKEGAANALQFLDGAAEFGQRAGLIERAGTPLESPALSSALPRPESDPLLVDNKSEGLTLEPGGEAVLPFPPGQTLPQTAVLSLTVRVEELPQETRETTGPPPGPDVPISGEGEFQGHSVPNEPSRAVVPPWEPPEPPRRVDDLQVASLVTSTDQRVGLPELQPGQGEQTLELNVGDLDLSRGALHFHNRNTHRRITITDVQLTDPAARGEYRPTNALSEAQDAILEMDGVRVTRGSNQIDDLLPGVNLTLHRETDREVTLEIDTDVESIKNSIIEFVGYYNQLLTQIDILSRSNEQIVDDVVYFTENERERALEQLGMLQGDLTINQIKNRLREIVMQPYPTAAGNELSMLVQIGISTDTSRPGTNASLDRSKLRGYLEIDEAMLEQALSRNPDEVGQLFGSDTDGDFVVDTGVAFAVTQRTRPYTQTGGLIAGRMSTIDTTASRRNRELETLNRQLEDKEAKLRRQYAMMEGMLGELEQTSRAIDNFGRSQGGGSGR